MQIHIADAESHIYALLKLLEPPGGKVETEVERSNRLHQIVSDGLDGVNKFGTAIERFVTRGFAVYTPRRSLRYRLANKRWDRVVAAERRQLGSDAAPR